jgi:hypothetical protein
MKNFVSPKDAWISPMQARLICTVALMMVFAGGCSRQETGEALARRLSTADRLVVLNPIDGAALSITDDLLNKVVQALRTSQKLKAEPSATPGYTLVFYNSRVHLATVPTGADIIFYIDGQPYQDDSGTLRVVCERFWEKHPSSH